MTRRVLLVDDEKNVLEGYRRRLHKAFDLDSTTDPKEALQRAKQKPGYAVIVSDMRMPELDGASLLREVSRLAPHTVRMMVTGCAELEVAIKAVNDGNVFRFLTKPCPIEALRQAIEDALRQYELLQAERVLLEQTLSGTVKMLCEVLSLANPVAFGCANRIHRLVRAMVRKLRVSHGWQCEIAALLSQLGCISIPQSVLEKAYQRRPLNENEQKMLAEHPQLARSLLSHIPRLERVAEIVAPQATDPAQVPFGVHLLRLATDFDQLQQQGVQDLEALAQLRAQGERYDAKALAALESVLEISERVERQEISVIDLQPHMVLAEDVRTNEGAMLVSKGQEVTISLKRRLVNFVVDGRLNRSIPVLVRTASNTAAAI